MQKMNMLEGKPITWSKFAVVRNASTATIGMVVDSVTPSVVEVLEVPNIQHHPWTLGICGLSQGLWSWLSNAQHFRQRWIYGISNHSGDQRSMSSWLVISCIQSNTSLLHHQASGDNCSLLSTPSWLLFQPVRCADYSRHVPQVIYSERLDIIIHFQICQCGGSRSRYPRQKNPGLIHQRKRPLKRHVISAT